jgi:hypothetical protein
MMHSGVEFAFKYLTSVLSEIFSEIAFKNCHIHTQLIPPYIMLILVYFSLNAFEIPGFWT